MDALQLLSGDAQTFVDKVWASHVHIHRTAPDEIARLLRLDDVDHLLASTAMRTPALRVAQDGTVLPSSRFTRSATLAGVALSGLVDPRKTLDLFDGGATLVLQGLHRYWPPLTDLVRSLELQLGHPCQANAYLTPPGSQGFALHSDSHDVFVFQTYGRKLWEVHDDDGRREVLLEPGVSMYLPTGTLHAARTQSEPSLHVTVGVNQVTWRDVLDRIAAGALSGAGLDAAVPAGYLDDQGALADGLSTRLADLAHAIATVDAAAAAAGEADRFLSTRTPHLAGGLRDRLSAGALHDTTVVHRRPGSVCVIRPGAHRLRVLLGDRELRMPLRLTEPMDHLRRQESLRPADLAGWLDPESRLVLVRRLVREGLLQVRG